MELATKEEKLNINRQEVLFTSTFHYVHVGNELNVYSVNIFLFKLTPVSENSNLPCAHTYGCYAAAYALVSSLEHFYRSFF